LATGLKAHLADGRRGERLRDGFHVAVLGAPNVGKSSLVNALAGREAAIVSQWAGTTRDVVEVNLDIGGWPVVIADTAGIRNSTDPVETEGVRRALDRAERVDLRLLVIEAGTDIPDELAAWIGEGSLVVANKIDKAASGASEIGVSALTGEGLDRLVEAIGQAAATALSGSGEGAVLTRARHRDAVGEALAAIERARIAREVELVAEDLRLAARAIGRIAGRVDVEDLLDLVFGEFCIGK
jgi:tRNA modification GTPase